MARTVATLSPVETHPSTLSTSEARAVQRALGILESRRLRTSPYMLFREDFEDYLKLRFVGCTNEQGHVLYLNSDRRLLAGETEFLGDQKSVRFDLRRIVYRAVQLGADHIVFAHNHPNDCATPSDADMQCLDHWERILPPLSLTILDSFVVTTKAITSIRQYRDSKREREQNERQQMWERRSQERRAKMAATRAAKRAAVAQGASA